MSNPVSDAVARFNNDQKGKVKIVENILSQKEYEEEIVKDAKGYNLPDLHYLRGADAKKYGQEGKVLDLTDYLKNAGIFEKYYPHTFIEHVSDGKYYSLPREDAYYGFILYNKDIFDEVGISSFPKTYHELLNVSEKLKKAGYIPMALGDREKWPADSLTFSAFVNSYVGNEWFEDIFLLKGKSKFTDPEFIKALTDFQNLAKSGFFNKNFYFLSNGERIDLFLDKKAAMISAGNWECNYISEKDSAFAENVYVEGWPVADNNTMTKKSIVSSSAWGFAVSSNVFNDKMKYIVEFLSKYVTNEKYAEELLKSSYNFV